LTPAATTRFAGFPEGGIQFFLDLQAEQTRTWFKAHEADFERLWKRPLEQLTLDIQSRLTDAYPRIAEASPHYFRIQRDTRFSKDKTPYKTFVAADLPIRAPGAAEDRHAMPGLYLSFGLEGEYVGMGAWHMPPDMIERFRRAVADDRTGAEVQSIVDDLTRQGYTLESVEALKRVPAPYPQDHPRGDLLKRKGLAAAMPLKEDIANSPQLADWAEARLRALAPLAHWLDRHTSS
jgi:uncharacterized protein (TIGR02453 family)